MNKGLLDSMRPYNDDEIPSAMARMAKHPIIQKLVAFLHGGGVDESFIDELSSIKSVKEFQEKIVLKMFLRVMEMSDSKVLLSGFDKIEKEHTRVFIANHRDISLDSAIFEMGLFVNGCNTSQVTFGSNLMSSDFIIDFGKSNKMFKVERNATVKDFFKHSQNLSMYIKYTLTHKKESVWIAQRNGRTKDGNDKTEPALIKMLAMSVDEEKGLLDEILKLNITPTVISYEIEPCIRYKTQEVYLSQGGASYVKKEGEDLRSIIEGIKQKKGRIKLNLLPCINKEISKIKYKNKNDLVAQIAQCLDRQIYLNYELFPNNYIAFDILNKSNTYLDCYTKVQKEAFEKMMQKDLYSLEGEVQELRQIYLRIYANPLRNKMLLQ